MMSFKMTDKISRSLVAVNWVLTLYVLNLSEGAKIYQHLWDEESRLQSGPGFAPTNLCFSMPQSFRNTGQFVSVFSTWPSPGRNRNFGSSSNIRNCEVSRACPWVRLFLLCQIYLLSEHVGGSSAVFFHHLPPASLAFSYYKKFMLLICNPTHWRPIIGLPTCGAVFDALDLTWHRQAFGLAVIPPI